MIKKIGIKMASMLVITSTILGFTGCGKENVSVNNGVKIAEETKQTKETEKNLSKVEQILKDGKIILGTCADYPPYEFHKIKDGKDEIVGFDIDIAKSIAEDLGVELEVKEMDFKGLIPALQTGKIDFIISGMTPTPERMQEVDFSEIYYKAVQSVIIREEDKNKYSSLDTLSSAIVGVQKTSLQEEIAKEQIPGVQLKSLGKVTDLILSLKNRKVDAIVVENPVAQAYTNKTEGIAVSNVVFKEEDGGSAIAVQKGSADFVQAINKTIERLIKEDKINQFVTEANESIEE